MKPVKKEITQRPNWQLLAFGPWGIKFGALCEGVFPDFGRYFSHDMREYSPLDWGGKITQGGASFRRHGCPFWVLQEGKRRFASRQKGVAPKRYVVSHKGRTTSLKGGGASKGAFLIVTTTFGGVETQPILNRGADF